MNYLQEYRYRLPVIALGITASKKWTLTTRGLRIRGPEGFSFNELEYKSLRRFCKLRSVMNEFKHK